MFKPLYQLSKNGKVKQWVIQVIDHKKNGAEIHISHGYIDGIKTEASQIITEGKNIGRINETTPLQQAIKEAESKYQKKLDAGFTEEIENVNNEQEKVIFPMLALNYENRGSSIKFPCFVQRKLDGVRSLWYNNSLWSRNAKEFPHLNHIKDEIREFNKDGIILDGELYSYDLTFQEVVGLVKKQTLTKEDEKKIKKIKMIVYDYVDTKKDFKDRLKILEKLFSKNSDLTYVELLETEICESEEQVYSFLDKYEKEGYEGLILRNMKGVYETDYRSENLQKLKSFQDSEFEIIDYTDGVGAEKGLIIFICQTKQGKEFRVRPAMSHEERKEMYKNGKKYIGKLLTVKYQTLTNDGVPRFPVGLAVREYE